MPEYRAAWGRQFRWLALAVLDAGQLGGASRAALDALGAGSWEEAARLPGAAARYLVARVMAEAWEAHGADPGARAAAETVLGRLRRAERLAPPYEYLWLHHVGCLAGRLGEHDLARDAWSQSARLCAAQASPTRRAVALLPLASLAGLGGLNASEEALAGKLLADLGTCPSARVGSWASLVDGLELAAVLTRVAASPARFFPFARR